MPSSSYILIDNKNGSYSLFSSIEELEDQFKYDLCADYHVSQETDVKNFILKFCENHEIYRLDQNMASEFYEKIKIVNIVSEIEFQKARKKAAKLDAYISSYLNLPDDEKLILRQKINEIEGR